jgi:hypothetical protein
MIPNIKSSEGIGDGVLKKVIHAGSESIMFSASGNQYVYLFNYQSERNCIQLPGFCH